MFPTIMASWYPRKRPWLQCLFYKKIASSKTNSCSHWSCVSHRSVSFISRCGKLDSNINSSEASWIQQIAGERYQALKEVKMDRTSATHKLKDSLATNNHTKLVEKIRPYLFSVNIDKCVHGNNKKVFSVFVTFYDKENTRLCCGALRLSRVRCCICASFV